MAIFLNNVGGDNQMWREALASLCPHMAVYTPEDDFATADIHYALVWGQPEGQLAQFPNLKAVQILGAGTEYIDNDTQLPDVPVIRLIDPQVMQDMAQYVLYWVLCHQRQYRIYENQQQQRLWQRHEHKLAGQYRILILGMGNVGQAVATLLKSQGFSVSAYRRRHKTHEGIHILQTKTQLYRQLENTDCLVNCLALNQHTTDFIDAKMFNAMPDNSQFINISRGRIVKQTDLLAWVEKKEGHAVLDTHCIEPLPVDDILWDMSNVTITPHISGATYARTAAKVVVDNITKLKQGQEISAMYFPPQSNHQISVNQ